jgi:hypothetical protein
MQQAGAVPRGEEHVVGGGATLTRERLAELIWLHRREPEIPVEHEGDRPDRLFAFPRAIPLRAPGLDGRLQTPSPSVSWPSMQSFETEAAADTQLGVSTTHVVVTTRTHIAFYNKAGVALGSPIYVGDFFKDLGLDRSFGISTYFDSRSIFDPYRRRFWLGALAIKYFPDRDGKVPDDNRTKFAAAVSSSENPQDPWYLYWWDAVAHDGVTPDPVFQPGDWADYPILGIDRKCIYQVNGVNGKSRSYGHVVFFPADQIAAGDPGPISGWQFWDLQAPDGKKPGLITPAVHHGRNSRAFFAGPTYGSDALLVWGLRDPLGPTQLMERAEVKISTLGGPRDARQSGSTELIKMTNLGTQPLRASCRNNQLSLTLNDSADWQGNGTAIQSNRLLQIDVGSFPLLPSPGDPGFRERIFGLNNPIEDDRSTVFSYGWPVVEANAKGDVVIVYSRTGGTIDPQIRFSTWMHGESDIRPSRLLKAGEKPYKLSWASPGPLPWADTGGISVDPFDDEAVWFAHCYADSHSSDGNYAIYVGKVFGSRWPWWILTVHALEVPLVRPGDRIPLTASIANGGDGPAPATLALVQLIGRGDRPIRLAQLRVPALAPGASAQIDLPVITPDDLGPGTYQLEVSIDHDKSIRQYSNKDSTGRSPTELTVEQHGFLGPGNHDRSDAS